MRVLLVCCAFLVAACGSTSVKRAGEACTASSECASGLLCDLAMKPAVCAGKSSLDAAPRPVDAKPIDAPADAPPD